MSAGTQQRREAEPLLAQQHPPSTTVDIHGDHPAGQALSASAPAPPRYDRLQHHREMVRERFSLNWWLEWTIIIIVFSVTGSSTMLVVKPLIKALGLTGSLGQGPWSFRIAYVILTFPLYSCMLLLISSLVCRRPYFENLLIKTWSRLLPSCIWNRLFPRE